MISWKLEMEDAACPVDIRIIVRSRSFVQSGISGCTEGREDKSLRNESMAFLGEDPDTEGASCAPRAHEVQVTWHV